MAEFTVHDNAEQGRYEVELDGATAFAEYRVLQSGVLFPHTDVPAAHEGKGVGSALVRYALDEARAKGLQVMPVCTFFAGYIARHPEYHDLVHPGYRAALGI